ncbi:MAG TPA: glycosyltransferase, partial [Thermoanaerobaculia bacterium]|nr:glycosyltransferase [Thermoanaerobaculia bacterium]
MHALLLPSWYHTGDKPWRGMFFRDQALALIRHGVRAGVVFVERKSFSTLTPAAAFRQRFQIESANERGIPTVRMKAWGVFPQTTRGGLAWTWLTKRAVRAYVATHGLPDIIHGHGALWGGYAAMLVARELGVPYVITEHASSAMR